MKKTFLILFTLISLLSLTACMNMLDNSDKVLLDEVTNTSYDLDSKVKEFEVDSNNSIFKLESEKGLSYFVINHNDEKIITIDQLHKIHILRDDMNNIQKATLLKKSKEMGEDGIGQYKKFSGADFDYKLAGNDYYIFIHFNKDTFIKEDSETREYENLISKDLIDYDYSKIKESLEKQGFKQIN